MRVLLTAVAILFIPALAFAETNQTEDWRQPELDAIVLELVREERAMEIYEELAQNPDDQRKAELFHERAMLGLESYEATLEPKSYEETLELEPGEAMYNLSVATHSLLDAIKFSPENEEYKEALCDVYEKYWRDKDFSGDDEDSKIWQAIKDKAKIIVEKYGEEEIPEHVEILAPEIGLVYEGMPKEDLYKVFSELQQKDYRKEGNEEWITFSDWTTEERGDLITFHLVDDKVKGWKRHPMHKRGVETHQSEI